MHTGRFKETRPIPPSQVSLSAAFTEQPLSVELISSFSLAKKMESLPNNSNSSLKAKGEKEGSPAVKRPGFPLLTKLRGLARLETKVYASRGQGSCQESN